MSSSPTGAPVWFITGCSSGLGRALAEEVLRRGQRCVVTARSSGSLRELQAQYPQTALVSMLDVTDAAQRERSVCEAEARFGRIDVLVNNAGFGYLAAIEEGEDAEIRALFETNFFAAAALTRRVLPLMRSRSSGHIINISSVAGVIANPSTGFYSATKFALEGLSEALAKEVRRFGIKVTIVQPGPFRTDFYARPGRAVERPIQAYAETAGARREILLSTNGHQAGDPERAAQAIFRIAQLNDPPLRLPLGTQAIQRIHKKLQNSLAVLQQWEAEAIGADFPEAGEGHGTLLPD